MHKTYSSKEILGAGGRLFLLAGDVKTVLQAAVIGVQVAKTIAGFWRFGTVAGIMAHVLKVRAPEVIQVLVCTLEILIFLHCLSKLVDVYSCNRSRAFLRPSILLIVVVIVILFL